MFPLATSSLEQHRYEQAQGSPALPDRVGPLRRLTTNELGTDLRDAKGLPINPKLRLLGTMLELLESAPSNAHLVRW
ncbi:hypothetical protein GCM10007937_01560 [Mesorhizobium albiziae]|nr:hypothetical protein GCM10007937_01560 [Mesorhizobium albiziae]